MSSSEWTCECSGCPSTRLAPCHRNKPSITAILVEAPTALEQAKHQLLAGDSGKLVKQILRHYGLEPNNCYITTALNCRPNMKKDAMVKKAMLACRQRVLDELKVAGVERVLCLGSVGYSQLMGADKVLPITKMRGRWMRAHGMDVMATFNPGWLFGEPDYFRDFSFDLEKFATTDPQPEPNLELWQPDSVQEMQEAFDFLAEASFVSCDLETTGLSVYSDRILAAGFGALYGDSHDGVSVIVSEPMLEVKDTWVRIGQHLARVDQASVLHNSIFDLKFIRRYLLELGLPYDPQHIEDTMFLNYSLDERPMGRFKSHSLKNMSRVRCDAPDYDINMKKWLEEWANASVRRRAEMRAQMHEYLALDAYYTARMFPDLLNEVVEEDPALLNHYQNVLLPGAKALVEIHTHGAGVDRSFFEDQSAELDRRAAPILIRVREYTGIVEFNPNSPKQVADYLYGEGEGQLGLPVLRTARRGKLQEGKTSKQILKMLRRRMEHGELPDHIEFLNDILEYRNLVKNAGTYVKGILRRMDDDDRIRCDLLPHGTSTGRLSSSNPNLQNIPEASHTKIEIRNGYCAPDGWLLGNADYSQLELRVAAWLSGDENFTKVYVEGRDLHQEVAFSLFGKPKEQVTPYERYMAKCCSFGVLYGRGAGSLANGPEMDYVEDELGGRRWSEAEVKDFFDKFFDNFPQFREWTESISKFAYREQYVQTPFGNKRRFPFIPRNDNGIVHRAAVNSPIQGTAALITFGSLIRIHERFKQLNAREGKMVAYVILTVHDSIMFELDPAYIDEVRDIVLWEMEKNIPFKDCPVPMKADVEFAPRWGQVKDWNLAENLPAFLDEESREEVKV